MVGSLEFMTIFYSSIAIITETINPNYSSLIQFEFLDNTV